MKYRIKKNLTVGVFRSLLDVDGRLLSRGFMRGSVKENCVEIDFLIVDFCYSNLKNNVSFEFKAKSFCFSTLFYNFSILMST